WITDGSQNARIGYNYVPKSPATAGGLLYFTEYVDSYTRDLWVTDGSVSGAKSVKRFSRTNGLGFVDNLQAVGDKLFFQVVQDDSGRELWVADGQTDPVLLDLYPGTESSSPGQITAIDGLAYFFAQDGEGQKLWKSDGTVSGTQSVITVGASDIPSLLHSGNKIYLVQSEGDICCGIGPTTMSFYKLVDNKLDPVGQLESDDPFMETKANIAGLIFVRMGGVSVLNTQTDKLLSVDLDNNEINVLGEFDGYVYLENGGVLYKTDGSEDSNNSGFVKIEQVKELNGSTL
ncbi:hypothetical protein ABMA58_14575, partial [Oceanospirillum sp. HFRX-1_2]